MKDTSYVFTLYRQTGALAGRHFQWGGLASKLSICETQYTRLKYNFLFLSARHFNNSYTEHAVFILLIVF